jgi:mevalonate kinase
VDGVRIAGKAMLSGEYAVLYGGTAALVPVKRYLCATDDPASAQPLTAVARAALELRIPELADHERDRGLPRPQIDAADFFTTDASGQTTKLGLGASAAEAVATVALRFMHAGLDWRDNREAVFDYAREAHTAAQHGLGSGADVAACAYAEPISYVITDGRPRVRPVPNIPRQCVPTALAWTGQAADTRLLVQRFCAWVDDGGSRARDMVDRLVAAADTLAPCWFMAASDKLFAALGEFQAVLNMCVTAAGLPYRLPAHQQLASWAVNHGGKAKPVGAGGGDMLLLVGHLPYHELDVPLIRLEY